LPLFDESFIGLKKLTPTPAAGLVRETASFEISRCEAGKKPQPQSDILVREEPLEIRVRGKSIAVTMRTPGHDRELAAGFLLSEGVISHRNEIIEIAPCLESDSPENTLNVFVAPITDIDFARLTRHVFASSSCGLCGKASIESVHQHFPPVGGASVPASRTSVTPEMLTALPDRMRAAQQTFSQTGGLHAAAIFDFEGNLLVLREDAGRHNAVDKVLGWGFLESKLPFDSHVLLVSGRASFEIVQKALAARIPIIAAVSAPSSLAVEFAQESNQTLVGFLRGTTFNIYSHPDRISVNQDDI
jgi:FdhD protein